MRLTSPPISSATPVPQQAITAAEFAAAMAGLAPYESRPCVAVAVSGGADSMALAHLAQRWVNRRQGSLAALIVDHGLRPESAAEAKQVAGWLRARDMTAHVLTRIGPIPAADIQAAARTARYHLLLEWCASHGVVHLLLGHHLDDQAETFLLRLGRGSGLNGLAAMATLVERPAARLLRPLLAFTRARLHATARRARLPWIEDPSNRDPRHARARLRAALPALGDDLAAAARLAATARHLGRARAALDAACGDLLGRGVTLHPAGFLLLDSARFRSAPDEISLRALSRCVATIGGAAYGPRLDRLARLHAAMIDDPPTRPLTRTLAGCRISRQVSGVVVINRETAAVGSPAPLPRRAGHLMWGLYSVKFPANGGGVRIAALAGGRRQLAGHPGLKSIPAAARPILPAIWRRDDVIAVPHVGFLKDSHRASGFSRAKITFCPVSSLSDAPFAIV